MLESCVIWLVAIADDLDTKICVRRDKMQVLECLDYQSLTRRLTMKLNEARVHVVNMGQLNITVSFVTASLSVDMRGLTTKPKCILC